MSEENSSSIGTMIVVAIAAGLIGFVVGKPTATQKQANNGPAESEEAALLKEEIDRLKIKITSLEADNNESAKPEEPTESKEPAFVSDGLVAHYPFNGNTNDQSVNGNDGKSTMAKFSIDRHGNPSGSLVCDGAKGKVTVDGNKQIQDLAKKDATISLWVKLDRQQPISSILRKEKDYLIYAGKNGELYVERFSHEKVAGGFHRVNTTKGVTVNRWMHVCCTWGKSEIKLYLDSKHLNLEKEERSHLPVSLGVRRLLSFGIAANNNSQEMYGSIDDVRIYNRALSTEEVKALYDLEKPKGK
jgi:hypothetical protein